MRDDDLVTIDRFLFAHDAEIARATLEASGIDAVLGDEFISRMAAAGAHAHGGIRLMVRRSDATAATELLAAEQVRASDAEIDEVPAELVEQPGRPKCRRCFSEEIYPTHSRIRRFWQAVVMTMIAIFLLDIASCVAAATGVHVPPHIARVLSAGLPLGLVVGLLTTLVPPRMRCRNCGLET